MTKFQDELFDLIKLMPDSQLDEIIEFISILRDTRKERDKMNHILNEELNDENAKKVCPNCGKDHKHWHVEDYDILWQDGKVVCECGQFIRTYDAS